MWTCWYEGYEYDYETVSKVLDKMMPELTKNVGKIILISGPVKDSFWSKCNEIR